MNNLSSILEIFKTKWPTEEWKDYGFYGDDFLLKINPFWLGFEPPSHTSYYFLAFLYTAIMICGVVGNVLVIFMFIRRRSLRTSANILVMNLAVSDFFMLAKMPLFIFNCWHFGPVLGDFGCELYGFLGGLTGTVSIMTLAAISWDRYHVIAHPLVTRNKRSNYLSILCTWLYAAIFATLPLLNIGFNRYVPEGYLTSCSFDYLDESPQNKSMIVVFFLAAWCVPFVIISICYLGIYRAVLLSRKPNLTSDSSRHCKEEEKRRAELKLAGIVICVVALWFCAWTPYAVVALLGVTGRKHLLTPFSSMIPALFCKIASCVDPFVYAVTHPRFRFEMQSLYRRVSQKGERRRDPAWSIEDSKNVVDERTSVEEMMVVVENKGGRKRGDVAIKPSCFTSPFYTNLEPKTSPSFGLNPSQPLVISNF